MGYQFPYGPETIWHASCLRLIRIPSWDSELRKDRHSREGGNPVFLAVIFSGFPPSRE
jgi:hypothetical protein